MKIKRFIAVASLIAAGILGASSAQAIPVTWDFSVCNNCSGSSFAYSSGGNLITATGFTNSNLTSQTNLFAKNNGGDEKGIGLKDDPTKDNEISGKNLVRLDLGGAGKYTSLQFAMNSATGSEQWEVWGSNSANSIGIEVASGNDERLHSLTGNFQFYFFGLNTNDKTSGDNVLLASLQGVTTNLTSPVPEPSTWAMLTLGFFGIGFLAYRQKGKPALRLV
jgi:hypothetical protein